MHSNPLGIYPYISTCISS